MNKLYLITGFQDDINSPNYQDLIQSVKGRYQVVPIDLGLTDPRYTFGEKGTFKEILERAKKQIIGNSSKDSILGFSFGGLVAYQLSTQIKFKQVTICSICSILEGDLNFYPKKEVNKNFTPRQVKELAGIKYGRPLNKNYPTLVFFGGDETKQVARRSNLLSKNSAIVTIYIPDVGHKLSGLYLKKVKDLC